MIKRDLAVQLSHKCGMTVKDAENVIDELISITINKVSKGETIYLRGFGTLGPKIRKSKIGRDITKKKSVFIPERCVPFFKPSSLFKKKANALNKKNIVSE